MLIAIAVLHACGPMMESDSDAPDYWRLRIELCSEAIARSESACAADPLACVDLKCTWAEGANGYNSCISWASEQTLVTREILEEVSAGCEPQALVFDCDEEFQYDAPPRRAVFACGPGPPL